MKNSSIGKGRLCRQPAGAGDADHAAIARASGSMSPARLTEPGRGCGTDRQLGVKQQRVEGNHRPRRPRGSSDMIASCGSILSLLNLARRNGAQAARVMQHEPALRRFHAI